MIFPLPVTVGYFVTDQPSSKNKADLFEWIGKLPKEQRLESPKSDIVD